MDPVVLEPLLQTSFLGNSVFQILISGLVFLASSLILFFLQSSLLHRFEALSKKTQTDIDDTFIAIIKSIRPGFYLYVAFFISLRFVSLPSQVLPILNSILIILTVFQVITAAQIFIDFLALKYQGQDNDGNTDTAVMALKLIAKIGLWVLGILLVLSNLGIDVTSLVAGLGITGVAVALAVQNILGDLLSSFSIYFDKPFQVGDTILINGQIGTVQKVGIKTTRVKALQGEEIVIPNQQLTSGTIQNFKKLRKRRIEFNFGITYETDLKKVKQIPEFIQTIIDEIEEADFGRAHFHNFGDSALEFEVVYYVKTGDYKKYMDTQQTINIAILERFTKEKIEMAYPTRVVYNRS